MVEVEIDIITTDRKDRLSVVVLKEIEGNPKRQLLIWIGESEANAIDLVLKKTYMPRPMTHDLIKNIVDTLSFTVSAVFISSVEDNTFFAKLKLKSDREEFDIDSRPSDALAIAI